MPFRNISPCDESFGLGLGLTNMDDRDPETAPYSTSYPFLEQNIIPVPDYGMEAGQLQWVIDDNDEPWAGLEYPQSPPISEECNSSSTNSARNPSPPGTIHPTALESDMSHISSCIPYDFIPDLRTRTPMSSYSDLQQCSSNPQFVCTEGCETKSFGRSYDLNRHIKEQHRCRMRECQLVKFRTAKEKKDHERSHNIGGVGFRCGTCELLGQGPKALKRPEKLKNHFRDVHGLGGDININDFECDQEPCHLGLNVGGLFFISMKDLNEHLARDHGSLRRVNETASEICNGMITPLPLLDISHAKRKDTFDQHHVQEPKRSKMDGNIPAPLMDVTSLPRQPSSSLTAGYISGMAKLQQTSVSTFKVDSSIDILNVPVLVETFTLSIVEMHSLTKQHDLKSLIDELASLKISSVFSCKDTAVRLQGKCSERQMQKGKKLLVDLIDRSKLATASRKTPEAIPSRKINHGFQQVSVYPQPKMSALHPEKDSNTLLAWHQYLLPEFPNIAREASIRGKYSAALVHHQGPDGSHPIIRFRSSENQGLPSREHIRQRIKDLCSLHKCISLNVQFTEGSLVRLTGGSSAPPVDDPSNDQRFPHQRRPWKKPGMGASIGLSHCARISATLGGYILVDGRNFMISVDHFISRCRCKDTIDANKVRSPSISDIADVREQLTRKLNDIQLKIRLSAPEEIPLDQVDQLFTKDNNEELEQYKRFQRELEDEQRGFALGKIRYRCGTGEHPLRAAVNPQCPSWVDEKRSMDWSLTEVTEVERLGTNVHRHRSGEPKVEDLSSEVTQPNGLGKPCGQIDEVKGGEAVHYVGTTSGLREGVVNASLAIIGDEEDESYEWNIVVPEGERTSDAAFKGDSGAWIISKETNRLLGLLWGWEGGLLLFTPIQDVFADIKRELPCQDIRLPDSSTPRTHRRKSTLLCRGESPSLIIHPQKELSITSTYPISPGPRLLSPTDIDGKLRGRRSLSVSSANDGVLSTVPSLVSMPSIVSSSSSMSLCDELCPKAEALLLESTPRPKTTRSFRGFAIGCDTDSENEWQFVKPGEESDEEPLGSDVQLPFRTHLRSTT